MQKERTLNLPQLCTAPRRKSSSFVDDVIPLAHEFTNLINQWARPAKPSLKDDVTLMNRIRKVTQKITCAAIVSNYEHIILPYPFINGGTIAGPLRKNVFNAIEQFTGVKLSLQFEQRSLPAPATVNPRLLPAPYNRPHGLEPS